MKNFIIPDNTKMVPAKKIISLALSELIKNKVLDNLSVLKIKSLIDIVEKDFPDTVIVNIKEEVSRC
jgi:hypothetical protein